MYDLQIREEELKNKIAKDFFPDYDTTKIIGDIDFCVANPQKQPELFEQESLLWAESKRGNTHDLYESFVQLILTIGKARTFDKNLPPAFLGAFDAEKIGFLPFYKIIDTLYKNDFNWNVTPSDHGTKEFKELYRLVSDVLNQETLIYKFEEDTKELRQFISQNFKLGKTKVTKLRITKNNFISVYNKWLREVKPSISVNWEKAKSNGILDADFFLADLLSEHNITLKEKLFVLIRNDHYEIDRKLNDTGLFSSQEAKFKDKLIAHTQFWNKYNRPPKRDYWDYIVERRDLLVPQDVRERKGSYFTPQIWVEKSQQYLADVLGENWQDEYYIWDCCAGTGNMEVGLTNKYNVWASTLDQADVDVMKDRIKNGANMLENHIFQFDFLNDEFTKLPEELQKIINDPEKRRKLVIYINPPYAEAGNAKKITGTGEHKNDVAILQTTYKRYLSQIGIAGRELFAQFFIRIYEEIPGCILAEFSKLKILQASNFNGFRNVFRAHLEKMFIVPSWTFDNVKGLFPIGFFVWNLSKQECFNEIISDVIDDNSEKIGTKKIFNTNGLRTITDWIIEHREKSDFIGYMTVRGCDFQQSKYNYIINDISNVTNPRGSFVALGNLCQIGIYSFVVHCFPNTWLNDRDQFLYPNDGWKTDKEFQADCLCWTLFNNNIQSKYGINHWIPFTESEVNAQEKFESHFMIDFMSGKLTNSGKTENQTELFAPETESFVPTEPMQFSAEANAVFDAGRELWLYYHAQPNVNVNASLYDIKEYFQGRNDKGKMNNSSTDEHYNELIGSLRSALKILAKKNEPKVYEYGFLK
jgi:hypothetical protein